MTSSRLHPRQPLTGWRMRIIKPDIQRVWRQGRCIVLIQLEQGTGQVSSGHLRCCVSIGLKLLLARTPRQQRRRKKCHQGHHQHEQHQGQGIVSTLQTGQDPQPGVEPHLLRQPAQQRQTQQACYPGRQHHFDDVLVLEVSQLVRQHRFHFWRAQLLEQGVKKHHPLAGPETRKERIRMGRATATVHHEKSLGREARTRHQGLNAGFQSLIFQRRKLVEKRHDPIRRNGHQHQLPHDQNHPGPQPPEAAPHLHQPQHQGQQRHAQNQAQCQTFSQICKPHRRRHFVESKPLLHTKGLHP